MSRLQVGGLALVIKGRTNDLNVGKTVKLVSFIENHLGFLGQCWNVDCDDGLVMVDGRIQKNAEIEQYRLMPLGDKQTQDELAKEKLMFKSFNNLKYANCRTLVK